MRKGIVIALMLGFVLSSAVFAADYVVQSVSGKVEREVSPGKWEAVTEGAVLNEATVINTGLNSSLVLQEGGRTVTIKAMQKGTVERLAGSGTAAGVRIGGRAAENSSVTTARGTSNISTASTRASDAAGDLDWAEE